MRWPRREEETHRLAKQANEEIKREAAEQKAQDHQDRANIARVLRRLLIHKKAKEKHRNTEKKRCFTGKNVRGWLIAIGAVGAFLFAAEQWSVMNGQLGEMRQENRAWIAPTGAGGAEPNNGIFKFTVVFGNTGHEPATHVRYAIKKVPADTLDAAKKAAVDFVDSCENGKEKMTDIGASYPTSSPIYSLNAFYAPEFVESHRTPVVAGCFLYTTQHETHHSTFCFYFSAADALNNWSFCPFGNDDAN
jgi:hypothetical protein